jgi:hypothetical protein
MWHSNLEETFISRHILHQHWYTCPIALPVRRNPQHRSLLAVISAISALPFQPLVHQRNFATFLEQVVNGFKRQTLPTVNIKHFFMNNDYKLNAILLDRRFLQLWLKSTVFWVLRPYSWERARRFGRTYRPYLQGRRARQAISQQK